MGQSTRAFALAAILGFAGAGSAMAGLQQTYDISSAGPSSDSMTFDQFNPARGTLTGVVVTISDTSISGAVGATFSGGSGGGGVLLFAGPGLAIASAFTNIVDAISVGDPTCGWGSPNSGCSIPAVTPTDTGFSPNPDTLTDATDLNEFTGTGTATLTAGFLGGLAADGSNGTLTGSADFTGTVTVSYDYTPDTDLPEPASIGLFCAGTLVLAAVRRRRR